ncbi:hypothetical protein EBZ35_05935, partial [bacterium]|nr:hypothetical protein [bacterium]
MGLSVDGTHPLSTMPTPWGQDPRPLVRQRVDEYSPSHPIGRHRVTTPWVSNHPTPSQPHTTRPFIKERSNRQGNRPTPHHDHLTQGPS